MRLPAILIAILALAALPVAGQKLSWEYLEQRKPAVTKAVAQAKEMDVKATDDGAERAAYVKLGQALSAHPEMVPHNEALSLAKQALRTAIASGDPGEIANAQGYLTSVKTARYNKASSIPELKKLIEEWQAAAAGITVETKPSPDAEKNMHQVKTMLEQLQNQLGK